MNVCIRNLYCVFALIGALMIPGCATTDLAGFNVAGANRELDEWACDVARDRAECMKDYADDAGKRLLRGHLLVAVFARYGAARLEAYSDDVVRDATHLLGRVESAERELQRAYFVATAATAGKVEGAFYAVNRVDALLAIVDVVETATRPTRRGLFGFVALSSPAERIRDAPAILKRALRDKLYLDAYRQTLEAVRVELHARPVRLAEAWLEIDESLKTSCGELARQARLDGHQCLATRTELTAYFTKARTAMR